MIIDPSEQSKQDVRAIAHYLAEENPAVALRFLDALEHTYKTLSDFPDIGHRPLFEIVENLNTLNVKGFKHYHIFYTVIEDIIRIERGADGRRDLPNLMAYMSETEL